MECCVWSYKEDFDVMRVIFIVLCLIYDFLRFSKFGALSIADNLRIEGTVFEFPVVLVLHNLTFLLKLG